MKILNYFIILIIKFYKLFLSPIFGQNCRFLPSCSEYFIECLKEFGFLKGLAKGTKRILSCHPIKFLGGGKGFDPVKRKQN